MTTTAGPFVIKNGSLILKDGKLLVGDPSCCCSSSGVCCFWLCEYEVDIGWPDIENPEDVPDPASYSDALVEAGWVNIETPPGFRWVKDIIGVENCNNYEVSAQTKLDLEAEVNGIVGDLGGNAFVFPADSFGPACIDDSSREYCERGEGGNVFHPGKTCAEICCPFPCSEEHPCPEGCECVDGACSSVQNPLP